MDILGVGGASDYSDLDMLDLWTTHEIDDIAAQPTHETVLAIEQAKKAHRPHCIVPDICEQEVRGLLAYLSFVRPRLRLREYVFF